MTRSGERKAVEYRCERGHGFTVTMWAGAEPPAEWDCRCGARARRPGTKAARPPEPGPGAALRQVLQRRTVAQLEMLLAERLAELAERAAGYERPGAGAPFPPAGCSPGEVPDTACRAPDAPSPALSRSISVPPAACAASDQRESAAPEAGERAELSAWQADLSSATGNLSARSQLQAGAG
jgi:hypothetical protein